MTPGSRRAGSSSPIRTCVGCGAREPQGRLRRFHAAGGELVAGPGAGRGVYTCPRRACFERARAHRAFNRTLRRTVHVGPAVERLYT
jgi:predicted RNA-binding protein YlxR (DUF448 family)